MRKYELQTLQAKIKNNAELALGFNRDIQSASGAYRASLREQKKALGWGTRNYLLTYAFLRGMPYKAAEPACTDKPSVRGIVMTIKSEFPQAKAELEDLITDWLTGAAVDPSSILEEPKESSVQMTEAATPDTSLLGRVRTSIRSVIGL